MSTTSPYCSRCGSLIEAECEFCTNCGEPKRQASQSQAAPTHSWIQEPTPPRVEPPPPPHHSGNFAAQHISTPPLSPPAPIIQHVIHQHVGAAPEHSFAHLSPYYQEEFRKIAASSETYKGKWNWAAFFFGPIWALTKGAWLSSLTHLSVNFLVLLLTCGFGAPLLIIGSIMYGARGNYIYYNVARYNKQLAT